MVNVTIAIATRIGASFFPSDRTAIPSPPASTPIVPFASVAFSTERHPSDLLPNPTFLNE